MIALEPMAPQIGGDVRGWRRGSTTFCNWREADAPRVDLSNVLEECPAAYGHGHGRRELTGSRSPTHLIAADVRVLRTADPMYKFAGHGMDV
jgi:hypothetical protein